MAGDGRTKDGLNEEQLPTFYRIIRVPAAVWKMARRRSNQEKKAVRYVIDEVVDAELLPLVNALRNLGMKAEIVPDKLVQMPLNDNIMGRLNHARRETGLPAVVLLRICLQRFLAKKG